MTSSKLHRSYHRRKSFTLEDFESEEYLQQLSTYLNHKILSVRQ